MSDRLFIGNSGYHNHQLVDEEEDNASRESFFNATIDYPLSHSSCQFRFSLPGQHLTDDYRRHIRGFFQNEPCIYNHVVFGHAGILFDAMKHPPEAFLPGAGNRTLLTVKKGVAAVVQQQVHRSRQFRKYSNASSLASSAVQSTTSIKSRGTSPVPQPLPPSLVGISGCEMPEIEFASENEKRLTYQLVFQTLKYQKFLQDMLTDSKFFELYPEYQDELSSVMVILCDFKLRKFQRRLLSPGEVTVPKMSYIEDALYRSKIRLNAALARSRIKSQVLSIDWLLPDSVRKNDIIGANMHVSCWVNSLKGSMFYVQNKLVREGFREVKTEAELSGKAFIADEQFYDVLSFPNEMMSFIEHHSMVAQGILVIQDKSSAVGPHSVRCLISDDDDVLHVNVGSGLTSAHIASLTHHTMTTIYALGITSDRHQRSVLKNLDKLGARSRVKLLQGDFINTAINDDKLRDIKIVLITALCSKSGVANPVNFVVSEGEDLMLLRDLSLGYTNVNKVGDLVVQHQAALKHALRFPRVQGVVYTTRSLIDAENENVVSTAVEYITSSQQTKMPFRISPPVLPLTEYAIDNENPLVGKFLKYMPTNIMSGCFVAIMTREADDPKEAAKGILARAAARGIIAGVPELPHIIKEVVRPTKKKAALKESKARKLPSKSHGKKSTKQHHNDSDNDVSKAEDSAAGSDAGEDVLPILCVTDETGNRTSRASSHR